MISKTEQLNSDEHLESDAEPQLNSQEVDIQTASERAQSLIEHSEQLKELNEHSDEGYPGLDYLDERRLEDFEGALESSREDFLKLVRQIEPYIESGSYDSVLGDDRSGRFPAILFHHVLKRYAKEHGLKVPIKLFVAPSRQSDTPLDLAQNIRNYFQARKSRFGKKTLIVTDHIQTGSSIRCILEALPDDIDGDVVSISQYFGFKPQEFLLPDHIRRFHFFAGRLDSLTTDLYGKRHVTGGDKDGFEPVSHRSEKYNPLLTKLAREATIATADEVYDEVFTNPSR